MPKLVLVNRQSQVVGFDMSNHGLIVRIVNDSKQIIIVDDSGAVAFRCVPSDPAWPTNVGIVGEWLKRYGAQ